VRRSEDLLVCAHEALDVAREIVTRGTPAIVTAKGDRDYVSDLDLAVEQAVRSLLEDRTPEVGFLGEEGGWSPGERASAFWTLDPIDGTSNFLRLLPLCASSLALVHEGRTVVGAVDLPFLDMRYGATRGGGAFRDGVGLRCGNTASLSEAIVSIGDYAVGPGSAEKNALRLTVTNYLAASVERVRMLGSAAIDLAWVADGRLDASIMLSNKPWDTAAGVLIAREAGATVVDLAGARHDLHSAATIAAAAPLVEELTALLDRASGGDRIDRKWRQ
jgi:myo-inositol-1(or 4)-monophosphatase